MLTCEVTNPAARLQPSRYQKERRHRRFHLQLPVRLRVPSRGTDREVEATSENVSTCSLLLQAHDSVPLHAQVNLTMTVRGEWACRPILLLGQGEVVRVEPLGSGAGFAIAIACDRPLIEMENDLPTAG